MSLANINKNPDFKFYSQITTYASATAWDADMIHGCVCDAQWEGVDCSIKSCPTGDDPLTAGVDGVVVIDCTATSATGGFQLLLRGRKTSVIPWDATAATVKMYLEQLSPVVDEVTVVISTGTTFCSVGGSTSTITFHVPVIDHATHPMTALQVNGLVATLSIFEEGACSTLNGGICSVSTTRENAVCSNHGICDTNPILGSTAPVIGRGVCKCEPSFRSSDGKGGIGSRGDCGYSLGPATFVNQTSTVTTICPIRNGQVCNGRGLCTDHTTGSCTCDPGYCKFILLWIDVQSLLSSYNCVFAYLFIYMIYLSVALVCMNINVMLLLLLLLLLIILSVVGIGCDEQTCNATVGWFGNVGDDHVNPSTCGGVGNCDTTTGFCTHCGGNWGLFDGYGCDQLTCYGDVTNGACSGNGVCLPLSMLAPLGYTPRKELTGATYTLPWDADMVRGCSCERARSYDNVYYRDYNPDSPDLNLNTTVAYWNQFIDSADPTPEIVREKFYRGPYSFATSNFYGYDCLSMGCARGDNPRTRGRNEIQRISCTATSGLLSLKFRENQTLAMTHDVSAADLEHRLRQLYTIRNIKVTYVPKFYTPGQPRIPFATASDPPSSFPTGQPTVTPTSQPTSQPTAQPTGEPTSTPTQHPIGSTATPTVPSKSPTPSPTLRPTTPLPTAQPTVQDDDHLCTFDGRIDVFIEFLSEYGDLPLLQLGVNTLNSGYIFNIRQEQLGTKEDLECSQNGICSAETGQCTCMEGFVSSADSEPSADVALAGGSRGDCGFELKLFPNAV